MHATKGHTQVNLDRDVTVIGHEAHDDGRDDGMRGLCRDTNVRRGEMKRIATSSKLFDRSANRRHRLGRGSPILFGLSVVLPTAVVLSLLGGSSTATTAQSDVGQFAESRIFIEYNSTDNDLGFHVSLDGEDWKSLKIVGPTGRTIFRVQGKGGYRDLGLTELFFEGAEPSLFDVPLDELLALFPEGQYEFEGRTVDGGEIGGEATLTHAVPAGPDVSGSDDTVGPGNALTIRWNPVADVATDPAGGVFPDERIVVVAYQVIVGSFEVTLPATDPASPMSVTVPPEFAVSLEPGQHGFEVLAIDESGNQTITSGSFTK
jgi:hypothetical protein